MASRLLRLATSPLALRRGGPSLGAGACAAAGAALGRRGSKNLDWYINAIARREELKDVVEPPVFPAETLHGRKRARAFIDFQTGRDEPGAEPAVSRVVVELADDLVPLAVENFIRLCERPAGQGYKGSEVFHVRKGFGITMGDWVRSDGRGGHSAFDGRYFVDENFVGRHSAPGVLTLANSGVHTNNSVFTISTVKLPHLDGRHVVFGRVLTGLDAVVKISSSFAINMKPATPVVIRDAGRLPEAEWAAVDKALAAQAKLAAAAAGKGGTAGAGKAPAGPAAAAGAAGGAGKKAAPPAA